MADSRSSPSVSHGRQFHIITLRCLWHLPYIPSYCDNSRYGDPYIKDILVWNEYSSITMARDFLWSRYYHIMYTWRYLNLSIDFNWSCPLLLLLSAVSPSSLKRSANGKFSITIQICNDFILYRCLLFIIHIRIALIFEECMDCFFSGLSLAISLYEKPAVIYHPICWPDLFQLPCALYCSLPYSLHLLGGSSNVGTCKRGIDW